MLEYVRGLDLEPVRDAEMLWIAEEAYVAPLPPNWSQHYDPQGRVYYHHAGTGESSWKHPMDEAFRSCVDYARQAWTDGGFWGVDDLLIDIENAMRERLSDWMELYDAHGEKFYYNQRTQESTFDDPRAAVYHDLYARIKMVAKMKTKWPVLARAPRPEAPTTEELELQRLVVEEEQKYMYKVLKVQAMVRSMLARRAAKRKAKQREVAKGPQPLAGKLRLRLTGGKGHDLKTAELTLALTTPHRRERAAIKISRSCGGPLPGPSSCRSYTTPSTW
jgi:hypothetical protein